MAIVSLKKLPKLNNLIFEVRKDQEKRIVEELKGLKSFNNIKVYREAVRK